MIDVLELVRDGVNFDRITEEFHPDLTVDDVQACLRYAMAVVSSEELHVGTGT